MAEFLDSFEVERAQLLQALGFVEQVWDRFQRKEEQIEVEGSDEVDSMITHELDQVKGELGNTQFTIGIFGLIKRGKSTLLNSLIGRQVSSMHVTPETAVPVYVSYGQPSALVNFADGSSRAVEVDEVSQYTSQKHNPNNQMGVTIVQQQVPVGFLRNGVRLIDTPGLDDAEADEVYTERTLQELDVVDAGVVLFLSPPTVSATEMKFLEQVVARDLKKTFLVCNMYPQHFHDPETRNAVLQYVGGRIVEASKKAKSKAGGEVRVYPVCALEAWDARRTDDIDMWKKSGADRLLRDIENYLSGTAGHEVLVEAAERIVRAADMAKAEVRVRQSLLQDPDQLSTFREQIDHNIKALEHQFEETLSMSLTEVAPLRMRIRGLLLGAFSEAKKDIEEMEELEQLEKFPEMFKRKLEVRGELASNQFEEGFHHIVDQLRQQLSQQFDQVMMDIAPNLPRMQLSTGALMGTQDQTQSLHAEQMKTKKTSATVAAASGLTGGGAVMALAGTALLGPLGLLGGALVGWKLTSSFANQRSMDKAKEALLASVDEIATKLLAGLEEQINHAQMSVKKSVEQRRKAFASDLYQQFDIVQRVSANPSELQKHLKAAEQFIEAFDACSERAMQAVGKTTQGAA